ncbi:MAG: type IX secretion system membrane protein PorP/SprF [Flavobacteriales bacterium]
MRKIYIAIFAVVAGFSAQAQQDPQYTHFMFDKLSINPGYAGVNRKICGTLIGRQQWSGFDNAPRTALLNVSLPVDILKGGLGISYFNDKLGFESNNILRLSYSYHLGLGPGVLGIGASGGIVNKSIKAQWVTPDNGTAWQGTDPTITTDNAQETVPDFSFGLYYRIPNSLYVGLSATHLSQADLGTINIQTVRHYYIMAGYEYVMGDFTLMPNLMAKTDIATTIVDVNMMAMYMNTVWLGVSYRLQDAIAPMLGYQHTLKDGSAIRIGYSYDVTTSQLKNYSNGSHELMLNYCFNVDKPKPITKFKNPRFL